VSLHHGEPHDDPYNQGAEPDEPDTFACACGDESCVGHYDDTNIRIGKAWYAADCVMANNHPWVLEGREQDARNAERRGK